MNRGARARLCAGHRLSGPLSAAPISRVGEGVERGADHLTNDEMATLAASACRHDASERGIDFTRWPTACRTATPGSPTSVNRRLLLPRIRWRSTRVTTDAPDRRRHIGGKAADKREASPMMWAIACRHVRVWPHGDPGPRPRSWAPPSPLQISRGRRSGAATSPACPSGLCTPEVGTYCADGNVNNALAILDGLSTELADQVKTVTATDAASTCLTLDNGIEIAFGTAEDIRDKERIVLQIMADNPGKVSYINVRVPGTASTWRACGFPSRAPRMLRPASKLFLRRRLR
ncbi:MAG: cell division protein FtsQ/DivIB [Adlercreutzia equolifaciens]